MPPGPQFRRRRQGASLIAMLLALSLSLGITLSSLRVMAMSNGEYLEAEQAMLIDDQADHVFDAITRLLQHVGHVDPTQPMPASPARPPDGALAGHDDAQPAAAGGTVPKTGGVLGSDLLELHLPADAAGRILDCAGLPVLASVTGGDAGVSQLYVATDRSGEPELRCRTRAGAQWTSQALATGVAGFQLLYGVDADHDGLPNDFLSASSLRASDARRAGGQPSAWTRVVAVHVGLLLRSARQAARGRRHTIDLFGARYAELHGSDDPGVRIRPEQQEVYRRYQRYDAVIFLRNSLVPAA